MLLSSTDLLAFLHSLLLLGSHAPTTPTHNSPHVQLDHATLLGRANGSVESFLGISYAQPP